MYLQLKRNMATISQNLMVIPFLWLTVLWNTALFLYCTHLIRNELEKKLKFVCTAKRHMRGTIGKTIQIPSEVPKRKVDHFF